MVEGPTDHQHQRIRHVEDLMDGKSCGNLALAGLPGAVVELHGGLRHKGTLLPGERLSDTRSTPERPAV